MSDKAVQALDWMLEDYAKEQREAGKLPKVTEAKSYLIPILDKIERKPKPAAVGQPSRQEQHGTDEKVQQRANDLGWEIDRRAFNVPKPVKKKLTIIEQRLRKRIRLLTARANGEYVYPEWAAKIRQLNPLALNGTLGEEKRRHAAHLSMQIIEDSNRVFGDWRKDRGEKLFSTNAKRRYP